MEPGSFNDTIFAPATAPGRAGVAIMRISGPQAANALSALGISAPPRPRYASRARLTAGATQLDDALILWFPAPHSFTGENIVELHVHGGRAVMKALLEHLAAQPGLRAAEPGEFTRRAFLNGKIDLAQAEGLADLIDAETEAQRRQALAQLEGALGREFDSLRTAIIKPLAHLEAYIDFPEEEIPESVLHGLQAKVQHVIARIQAILDDGGRGERIREGYSVVILGAPNAGKSSLLNALARREAAIVSSIAGTTRDVIEVHLDMGGIPVVLVDTAGLRDSDDPIEQEGIRRARARAQAAHIKLVVFDATSLPQLDTESLAALDQHSIVLFNKCDQAKNAVPDQVKAHPVLAVSALNGDGIHRLIETLSQCFGQEEMAAPALLTRVRHRQALREALGHLERFSPSNALELACEELRRAAVEIGRVTGKIDVEDLLDRIFNEFCIGK